MTTASRPLSPHLQVYRLPLTALLSITHRITGVGLTIGTLMLAYWVTSAAYGPDSYANATAFIGSWFGYFCLLGFSACLFYHSCNGIRHLFWDVGKYFEIPETARINWVVIIATVVLTAVAWFVALN